MESSRISRSINDEAGAKNEQSRQCTNTTARIDGLVRNLLTESVASILMADYLLHQRRTTILKIPLCRLDLIMKSFRLDRSLAHGDRNLASRDRGLWITG